MMWKPAVTIRQLLRLLLLCLFSLSTIAQAQTTTRTNFRKMEPNVYAPDLYADRVKLQMTLIDLPGASERGSYWEVSYQLYFVSETDFMKALQRAPNGSWNPTPENFSGRILLGRGHLKRSSLGTLPERIYLSKAFPLKARVPDKLRTKFATILTSYTVKIFDARLASSTYRTGTFATQPFISDSASGGREVARSLLYANFYVTPGGELFYSQLPRNSTRTTWP